MDKSVSLRLCSTLAKTCDLPWLTSIDNDKLNSLVREGVIDAATDYSILAEIPSEPVDL